MSGPGSLRQRLGSWLVRQCVRDMWPATRFAVDTFLSPSVYMFVDRITAPPPNSGALEPAKRITALEQVLWPVIHPAAPKPIPLPALETNIRFRSWVRNAYLTRLFSDSAALRHAEATFAEDLRVAPTMAQTDEILGTAGWNRAPLSAEDAPQADLVRQYEVSDPAVKSWSTEDVLESIGCCVKGMSEFNLYCERNFVYEFYTKEYINALADALVDRAKSIQDRTGEEEVRILEVGAGNGQLAYLLNSALPQRRRAGQRKREAPLKVIATDSGVWTARHRATKGSKLEVDQVERLTYADALQTHRPHIVICSWMPMNDDWTKAFRATPTVQEYILIGEKDDGCCGHPWRTWGVQVDPVAAPMFSANKTSPHFTDSERSVDLFHWLSRAGESTAVADAAHAEHAEHAEPAPKRPPYELDGFERVDLEMTRLQLSRYDRRHFAANSHTIAFRRRGQD